MQFREKAFKSQYVPRILVGVGRRIPKATKVAILGDPLSYDIGISSDQKLF